MSRMTDLGVYFILIFLVTVLFALSFAPLTDYLTTVSSEKVYVRSSVADSKGAISYSGYSQGTDAEKVDLRSFADSKGVTYVDEEVLDEFSEKDKVRVIIKFRGDIEDLNLDEEGFEKKREFENSLSGELKKTSLVKLIDSLGDEIESIQVDHEFISMFDKDALKIRADLAWDCGLTGKGQTVCVIDTGIDYNHKFISEEYIGGYDFVNDDSDPMDDHGHGTYVSGIISNIAPGAKIIAAKALDENGTGYESDIIAAIDYCIENRDLYNISVISLAISGGSFEGYCDSVLVTKEANFAAEQGIFVVAASGNSGSDNLTAPACGTKVTSVGASTKASDNIPCLTNRNPLLDLLAPGIYVTSAKLGGGFEEASGTSVSTAVAAGAALLVLENEPLKPMELEYRFRSTGFLIERGGTNYPRIDVYNAINNIVTNTPSEQVGEQGEGNWEEYGPALPQCECFGNSDCFLGFEFCDDRTIGECISGDWGNQLCTDCVGEGNSCDSPAQFECVTCSSGPWFCQRE